MLITFIKLTYSSPKKEISCEVDLTATARYITNAGIQLVVGDIINVNKLPFEDKQKLGLSDVTGDLIVTHRRIDLYDSVLYIDMEFASNSM